MNILLTGSGGFIGKNIKEQLGNDYNFICSRSWDLNLLNQVDVDRFFAEKQVDMIIHSAAAGVRITADATKEDVAQPNIEMFDNLAKHVSKSCKMIVFGSGAEYDKSKPLIDVKEEDFGKTIPQDPYGYSKYIISKKIEKTDNILNLRLFGIYGKYESPTRVISSILNDIIEQKTITLNQNVFFSFIYINDFCKILKMFIDHFPKEKFINVAQKDKIDILSIAEIAKKVTDSNMQIKTNKEGLNSEYTCNTDILASLIADLNFSSYEKSIYEMYKFLKVKQDEK